MAEYELKKIATTTTMVPYLNYIFNVCLNFDELTWLVSPIVPFDALTQKNICGRCQCQIFNALFVHIQSDKINFPFDVKVK